MGHKYPEPVLSLFAASLLTRFRKLNSNRILFDCLTFLSDTSEPFRAKVSMLRRF